MHKTFCLFALLSGVCHAGDFAGYLEGDYRYLGAAVSGRVRTLAVREGERVAAGTELFTLENGSQQAALAAAQAQLAALRAQEADLSGGLRREEIARIEAQLAQAEAQERLAAAEHARLARLVKSRAVSAGDADAAKARAEVARGKVAELQASLAVARLPARSARREQVAAQIRAAQAEIDARAWQLAQTRVAAPLDGKIAHVFYRQGEWVGAGQPVVSLLSGGDMKALFYVPAERLPELAVGTRVQVSCPGCPALEARVAVIADRPEYTPPVLYSGEQQHALTYRIEATLPDGQGNLYPGQAITVRLP